MKLEKTYPPNYKEIEAAFPDCVGRAVFCYGDTVYNPFDIRVSPDLMEHEEAHSKRQGSDPASWWARYMEDATFRLDEEVRAFAAQYVFMRPMMTNREAKGFLHAIARALAAPLYGNLVSISSAEALVKRHARSL